MPFLPGIQKQEHCRFDAYIGDAESLAAAGFLRLDQLPGQPGMRKIRVTIFPDGTLPKGAPTANDEKKRLAGVRQIERVGIRNYSVRINLPEEEQVRRLAVERTATMAWEKKVRGLPRPPRLTDLTVARPGRGHLRLVWSA